MGTSLIILSILLAIAGYSYFSARWKLKSLSGIADNEKILTLTDKNFETLSQQKLILVDFWASWCAPCRMMTPILNEVAEELKDSLVIGKVDIELYGSIAQKYNVCNIPTMVLLKNGVEVNRFVGVKNAQFLINQIKNLKKSAEPQNLEVL